MKHEAERFLRILQEEIDFWYRSYQPKMYSRSFDMKESVYAEDLVEVRGKGTELCIRIKYNDLAMHESFWGNDVDTLLLMNEGYQVKKGWHKNIENFGYRHGGNFVQSAVNRFNKENELGIIAKIDY